MNSHQRAEKAEAELALKNTALRNAVLEGNSLRAEVERLQEQHDLIERQIVIPESVPVSYTELARRAEKAEAELAVLKAMYSGAVEGRAVLLQQLATGVSRTEHNETVAELDAERRRTDFLLEKCGLTDRAAVDSAISQTKTNEIHKS